MQNSRDQEGQIQKKLEAEGWNESDDSTCEGTRCLSGCHFKVDDACQYLERDQNFMKHFMKRNSGQFISFRHHLTSIHSILCFEYFLIWIPPS
uniref:Uncharacterized protein n=2 Tax=Musa acuminata subsp. malaccensis TaxID=214687 RepID=A0A804K427_MUSAM